MGMSASQVRFLSLQHRKHDVGRQLTTLANRKMALSRDMNRVSRNYTNALNQTKLKWSNDCGNTYNALNYDLMMKPNEINAEKPYIVTDNQGRVVVDDQKFYYDRELGEIVHGETMVDGKSYGLSYREIATMITSYSQINKTTGIAEYDNAYRLNEDYTGTGSPVTKDKNFVVGVDSSATSGLSSADGSEYGLVIESDDLGFENNFRYDIMTKLALMSEQEQREYKSTVVELYGSEEAKESEFYPVGSAWGDYYIAIANKEAYEDWLNNDQKLAISSAAQRSQNMIRTFNTYNDSTAYDYSAVVNGTNGSSTITYSLKDGNALAHVDMGAVVKKASDSDEESEIVFMTIKETAADGTVTETANSEWATQAEKYWKDNLNYDHVHNDEHALSSGDGQNYTDVYSIDLTYNDTTGELRLVYKNTIDDITNKYLVDYNVDLNDHLNTLAGGGTGAADTYSMLMHGDKIKEDGTIETWRERDHGEHNGYKGYYMGNGGIYEAITAEDGFKQYLNIVRGIVSQIYANEGVAIDENAMNKAYEACYQRFAVHCEDEDTDACNTGIEARQDATDLNTVMANRQQWHFDGWSLYQDHNDAAVDMNALFNCFVTYYSAEARNVGLNASGGVSYPTPPEIGVKGTGTEHCFLDTANGWLYQTITDGTCTSISSKKLATSAVGTPFVRNAGTMATGDENEGWFYIDSSGRLRACADPASDYKYPTGVLKEKIFKLQCHQTTNGFEMNDGCEHQGSYVNDASNAQHLYITASDGTVTHRQVVGMVEAPGSSSDTKKLYCLYGMASDKARDFIKAYLESGSTSNLTNVSSVNPSYGCQIIEVPKTSGGAETVSNTIDGQHIEIGRTVGASSYQIAIDAKVASANQYRAYLENQVDLAKDRIDQLENKLENVFSSVESKLMDYVDAICKRISEKGWVYDEKVNSSNATASSNYLNAMLENNQYFVTEVREVNENQHYQYTMKQATSINKIYQVHDTNAENIALAEYEAEKTLIASKEKKIDMRMNQLETEQEVINTELDSIKKIKEDNINTYFKIFA